MARENARIQEKHAIYQRPKGCRDTALKPLSEYTATESRSPSSFQKELVMGRELLELWRMLNAWSILFPHLSNVLEFAVSLQGCLRDPSVRNQRVHTSWEREQILSCYTKMRCYY